MAFSFEAKDKTINDVLFQSDKKFRVPRYQRPYAWGEEQIDEFWEDLRSNKDPYLIGSIILNKEPLKTNGYIDIIDGQQRLLTITILSAVMRDIAKTFDKSLSQLIHEKEIVFVDMNGNQSSRIIPGETTLPVFENAIQSQISNAEKYNAKTPEEIKVKNNYLYLKAKVENLLSDFNSAEQKRGEINKIREKVRNLYVIHVEVKCEEDAYEIFESTNARGVDLSVADLLKNLIFKKIPPQEDKDLAKAVWADITSDVESAGSDLKKFLRYYWLSKHSFVSEKRLFKEFKKVVTDWDIVLDDLWQSSTIYYRLLAGTVDQFQDYGKHYKSIFSSVFALRLMGVTQSNVLLLSLLRNFEKIPVQMKRIFNAIERFCFCYFAVCNKPANRVERLFSKTAIEIESVCRDVPEKKLTDSINASFDNLINALKKIMPTKDEFISSFEEIEYKKSEKSRLLIKYILGNINNYLDESDEYIINFDKVNIEHLLPQKPDKKWNLKQEDLKNYVNLIGNLTLLSKKLNSKAQNKIIKEKISEFRDSRLKITKELVTFFENNNYAWSEADIRKRSKDFAILSYDKIWKI